jgi:hypothetical protein
MPANAVINKAEKKTGARRGSMAFLLEGLLTSTLDWCTILRPFLDLVTYPKVVTAHFAAANRAIDPRSNQLDAQYIAVAIFRLNTDDYAMDFRARSACA